MGSGRYLLEILMRLVEVAVVRKFSIWEPDLITTPNIEKPPLEPIKLSKCRRFTRGKWEDVVDIEFENSRWTRCRHQHSRCAVCLYCHCVGWDIQLIHARS